MSERFGLRLDVLDRERLEEVRLQQELGANPVDHAPLGLISMDFLKKERIIDQLERASYDVVIIDECHRTDLGTAQDHEDSSAAVGRGAAAELRQPITPDRNAT